MLFIRETLTPWYEMMVRQTLVRICIVTLTLIILGGKSNEPHQGGGDNLICVFIIKIKKKNEFYAYPDFNVMFE